MMIYTLPFIAALIGWVTNFLAIKMLFHPRKEVKILGLSIQGIFPKRKKKLAERLGKVVSDELFSVEDIKDNLRKPENLEKINELLEAKIDDFLNNKLKKTMPMIGMLIGGETINKVKNVMMEEFQQTFPEVIDKLSDSMESELDVEKIVREKVENFSTDKLESILFSIMKKEFRFIELVGAVLGFLIGWVQILLLQVY